MHAPNGASDGDRQAQERVDRRARADNLVERPGLRGLEQQQCLPVHMHELERSNRPRAVEVVLQAVLMREAVDGGGCWLLGARLRHQKFLAAVTRVSPHPAVETLTVVPKDVERLVFSTASQ